ncbi:MAG: hypothetical protein KA974_10615 [Saprospiraceae bacterium]|nr:hypothetical protein [Saprospiraceae bacterium]MBP7680194.1 hypothetical protein [Saprospiraceae bacterium]
MKRAVAILFLSIYLFATTHLGELLKFPLLIEHYYEHKAQDNSITFLGFLEMHYAHGNVKDADYDKDMKLPFKSINFDIGKIVYYFQPQLSFTFKKPFFIAVHKQKFPRTSVHISSSYLDAIWQPPCLK